MREASQQRATFHIFKKGLPNPEFNSICVIYLSFKFMFVLVSMLLCLRHCAARPTRIHLEFYPFVAGNFLKVSGSSFLQKNHCFHECFLERREKGLILQMNRDRRVFFDAAGLKDLMHF